MVKTEQPTTNSISGQGAALVAAAALGVLVPRLGRMIESTLQTEPGVGVSLRQFRMLDRLDTQPYRVGDLAAFAGVTQPTVSASVRALLDRNLAVRQADPADGRAKLVAITRDGRVVLQRAKECVLARLTDICSDVSDDEAAALNALVPVLSAGMDRVRSELMRTRVRA